MNGLIDERIDGPTAGVMDGTAWDGMGWMHVMGWDTMGWDGEG